MEQVEHEHGAIERVLRIAARPETVYEVISRPEHIREWWPDEAELDPVPGGTGEIRFGHGADAVVEQLTVVDADPPRRFSFLWVADDDGALLVTFELEAVDGGTLVRFSESGFRERGWEAAVLEQYHREHVEGWDHFLPRLVALAERVAA